MSRMQISRSMTILTLLLTLALLPSSSAAVTELRMLSSSNSDFVAGTFIQTALAQPHGVQLADAQHSESDSGVYLSAVLDLGAGEDQLLTQAIWVADLPDTTATVELAYRMAPDPGAFDDALPWTLIGAPSCSSSACAGTTITSTYYLGRVPAQRYLQYQATLRGSQSGPTPVLRSVAVGLTPAGYPNLWAASVEHADLLSRPLVHIENSDPSGRQPVLDADYNGPGTFWVDLYLFAPGETVITPTLHPSGYWQPSAQIYTAVEKSALPAGGSLTIDGASWYRFDGRRDVPVDWATTLDRPGTWTAFVLVDSYGNAVGEAAEAAGQWEQDNLLRLTIKVPSPVYLPLAQR